MRWGLIPSWATSASVGNRLINARAETVAERNSFRSAFVRRRCLVLADGFYEWQRIGNPKRLMRIVISSGEQFALAGLWDIWRDPQWRSGVVLARLLPPRPTTFCVPFTTVCRSYCRGEMESFWLDSDVEDPGALSSVLVPYPNEEMEAYEVSSLVNRLANDGPEVVLPIGQGAIYSANQQRQRPLL